MSEVNKLFEKSFSKGMDYDTKNAVLSNQNYRYAENVKFSDGALVKLGGSDREFTIQTYGAGIKVHILGQPQARLLVKSTNKTVESIVLFYILEDNGTYYFKIKVIVIDQSIPPYEYYSELIDSSLATKYIKTTVDTEKIGQSGYDTVYFVDNVRPPRKLDMVLDSAKSDFVNLSLASVTRRTGTDIYDVLINVNIVASENSNVLSQASKNFRAYIRSYRSALEPSHPSINESTTRLNYVDFVAGEQSRQVLFSIFPQDLDRWVFNLFYYKEGGVSYSEFFIGSPDTLLLDVGVLPEDQAFYARSASDGSGSVTQTGSWKFLKGGPIFKYYLDTPTLQLGQAETASLTVSGTVTTAGSVNVTLDGVTTSVAVALNDTAVMVADKIRATAFTGWTTGGAAGTNTVLFTSNTVGEKIDATFSVGTAAGITGTMTTTVQGGNRSKIYKSNLEFPSNYVKDGYHQDFNSTTVNNSYFRVISGEVTEFGTNNGVVNVSVLPPAYQTNIDAVYTPTNFQRLSTVNIALPATINTDDFVSAKVGETPTLYDNNLSYILYHEDQLEIVARYIEEVILRLDTTFSSERGDTITTTKVKKFKYSLESPAGPATFNFTFTTTAQFTGENETAAAEGIDLDIGLKSSSLAANGIKSDSDSLSVTRQLQAGEDMNIELSIDETFSETSQTATATSKIEFTSVDLGTKVPTKIRLDGVLIDYSITSLNKLLE